MGTVAVRAPELITSFNSRGWLRLAFFSRILIIILVIISDVLVSDHSPGDDVAVFHFASSLSPYFSKLLGSFTKWDSAFYLTIARNGMYTNEQQFAFYPMYPYLIRTVAHSLHHLVFVVSSVCSSILGFPIWMIGATVQLENVHLENVQLENVQLESKQYGIENENIFGGFYILAAILISNICFILSVGILRNILKNILEKKIGRAHV